MLIYIVLPDKDYDILEQITSYKQLQFVLDHPDRQESTHVPIPKLQTESFARFLESPVHLPISAYDAPSP